METWKIRRAISKFKRVKRKTKGDPNKKRAYKKSKYAIRKLRQKVEDTESEV